MPRETWIAGFKMQDPSIYSIYIYRYIIIYRCCTNRVQFVIPIGRAHRNVQTNMAHIVPVFAFSLLPLNPLACFPSLFASLSHSLPLCLSLSLSRCLSLCLLFAAVTVTATVPAKYCLPKGQNRAATGAFVHALCRHFVVVVVVSVSIRFGFFIFCSV